MTNLDQFDQLLINFDQFWKREWDGIFPSLFGGVRMHDFFVLPLWPKWRPVAPCGHNGTTKKSSMRVSQYPAKQWHIFLNFCVFIRRVIKANMLKHVFIKYVLMKISEICNGPFSAVSTNFWNFSSKSVRSRRAVPKMLFYFFFRIFFRGRNLTTKSEFSDIVANFWIFFSSNFWKFTGSGSRFGLILTDREERIQKFVDTAEKWLVENR